MSHPHAGGKPAPIVPTMAESPDSIAQSDHPMLGSRLFHRPFRGQTDADGLPYVADHSEADLLGASLGDHSVYGWVGADNLFGGSGQDLLVGGAGDDNLLGDRVFGVSDEAGWLTIERARKTMKSIATEVHPTLGKSGFFLGFKYKAHRKAV